MSEIRTSITINRPAHDIFEFTLDPDNTPKWVPSVVREIANERPARLGTVYRNQDAQGDWTEFEIAAIEPDSRFVMSKQGDDIHVIYDLRPLGDDRCELVYSVRSENDQLGERFTPQVLHDIIKNLKVVMEQPGAA